jgi:hypothetical protein
VEPLWVALNLPDDKAVTSSPTGEILYGDPKVVEEELIYLVENDQGTIDMLNGVRIGPCEDGLAQHTIYSLGPEGNP